MLVGDMLGLTGEEVVRPIPQGREGCMGAVGHPRSRHYISSPHGG